MEVYVACHNGMVLQLFRSKKILMSFRSDCHTFGKVKLVDTKPDNKLQWQNFFLKERTCQSLVLQDCAKNETNQMGDSTLA